MTFLTFTTRLAIVAIVFVAASTIVGTLSWIEHLDRSAKPAKKTGRKERSRTRAPLRKAA